MAEEYFKIRQSFILTQLLAALCCRQGRFDSIKLSNSTAPLPGSALQLLVILLKELTETGSAELAIPIPRIRGLRCLRDEKFARKQLLTDLAAIVAIQFAYRPSNKIDKICTTNISKGRGYIQNSILHFHFDNSFLPLAPAKQYMWLPYNVLHTSRNENISARLMLTWHICQHKRMNLDRTNADIVLVKSLLECSPIPSPQELGKAGQLGKRIVEPLERVLDRCQCFGWQYAGDSPESFTDFAYSKVIIHWNTDPYVDCNSLKSAKSRGRVKGRK